MDEVVKAIEGVATARLSKEATFFVNCPGCGRKHSVSWWFGMDPVGNDALVQLTRCHELDCRKRFVVAVEIHLTTKCYSLEGL